MASRAAGQFFPDDSKSRLPQLVLGWPNLPDFGQWALEGRCGQAEACL